MKFGKLSMVAIVIFSIVFAACNNVDSGAVSLDNKIDSVSYIIGQDYGKNLAKQSYEINPAAVYKGINDAINGTDLIPKEVRTKIVSDFNNQLKTEQQAVIKEQALKNKQLGATFLNQMKKQQGVVALPSGMQYKVIKKGKGKKPVDGDSVTLHYRGSYVAEKEGKFDFPVYAESYGSGPVSIMVQNTVPGLRAGLQMMTPGSVYEFYIPSSLGFGDNAKSEVVPVGATLIIRVELISIDKTE